MGLCANLLLGIVSLHCVAQYSVNCGNDRPYWVSITGFEGAGRVGQDASANGYAGSSLVSPLSASGFNSPLASYSSSSSYGNPSGAGFAGYGGNKGGRRSTPVAGGQGKVPYGSRR